MIENIKYINHLKEVFEFDKNGVFANENNLRDYIWKSVGNHQIKRFKKEIVQKKLPVMIVSDNMEIRNKLFEVTEKDILAQKYGRIVIGDYYLNCYITGIKKKKYLINEKYIELDIIITTDYPYWIKEKKSVFNILLEELHPGEKRNFDYNYDFNFDYSNGLKKSSLVNDSFKSIPFKLDIYGPCVDPVIIINNHIYKLNTELKNGEYAEINAIDKTIFKVDVSGKRINIFNLREKEHYIFKNIESGTNDVNWDGTFGFDITLYEERSEPKWI